LSDDTHAANCGCTRRDAVSAIGGIAAAAMIDGLCHPGAAAPPPASLAPKGYVAHELRDRIFWVSDGAYSTMFAVTDTGVVAFDAPPTLGGRYLDAIREVTEKPVTHLVYSHEHVDHIAAAHLFPKDVTIIAHRETAAALKRRNDVRRPLPKIIFDERHVLEVGGRTFILDYHGPNHSVDNIFISVPQSRILMLIDVIYPGWMPYKNLGVTTDVPGFVASHRQILGYAFDHLVAGHVDRVGTRADVELQTELVRDLMATAEAALARLSFPDFLKQMSAAGTGKTAWELHNDYELTLVGRMANELRRRWSARLKGVDAYLKDNCWAMLETYAMQGAPSKL
jgi:glyoxylase-like metal-dependent hydrolase (beta-lactamase superfamily II)